VSDEAPPRPLWRWILYAIAPGLLSAAMGAIGDAVMAASLLMPFVSIWYLIELGRRYVKAVDSQHFTVLTFVLLYGAINTFLWGAGCSVGISRLHF
jgi:hypothetical protein